MRVVYALSSPYNAHADAFTGNAVDSSGNALSEFVGYDDMKGHWAENIINALAERNIYKNEKSFRPDEAVTQKELFKLLYTARYQYPENDIESIYRDLIREGIISKDEKAPESEVTKQQAVRYLLKMMGHGRIADIKGIYKCDFADMDDAGEEYYGYIAIAKGLGIVNGDENNNFYPGKSVTNAEAAAIIYNYLKQ